jgi:hypothetical protein
MSCSAGLDDIFEPLLPIALDYVTSDDVDIKRQSCYSINRIFRARGKFSRSG